MQYENDFLASFMRRTRCNLETYSGQYDATQTINSLLGLLIVPKEHLFDNIPNTALSQLDTATWGDAHNWVTSPGKCDQGHTHPLTLRQFVKRLRNAAAHFKLTPFPNQGQVTGFVFSDRNGFKAEISVHDLRQFVCKLAEILTAPANTPTHHAP